MSVRFDELENGLRVVTHHMPHVETTSLGVWVKAGSRTEAVDEHGISHFLEHMAFKGTPDRTARDIVAGIESVGGYLNAATSLDSTCYYARVLKEDAGLALDTLADILQNPLFDFSDIEKEKDVILQEIAASQDSPEDVAFDFAHEAAYPEQPIGRPILGTEESVSSFNADMLRAYMNNHYNAANMVVSAAGAVDHDRLLEQAAEVFSSLKKTEHNITVPAKYRGGMKHTDMQFEQSHIILAFQGLPYVHDDFYAKQIFSALFGGGMSSRLFQEIREERGLCYSIYSFCWGMSDTGLFGIHAATGPEQLNELTDVVVSELRHIAEHGPNEKELESSKAQLKAGILMGLESTSSRAEQLARQVLAFNQTKQTEDLIRRVEGVTSEQVKDLIQSIINNSAPTCSGVGSFNGFKSYEWLSDQFRV